MSVGYSFLVFIHVLGAIGSIGPLFVMFIILGQMKRRSVAHDETAIQVFRAAVRFIKHAGHVLVGSGVLLIILGPWTWGTSWILATIVLMFISIAFLASAFKKVFRLYGEEAISRDEMVSRLNQKTWVYTVLLIIMLAFMVMKP